MEEEDKYWETHSPLDEGFEGEIQTSEQKRSSFLSVRMTGDELSQLRDEAAKLGMGPSTYARLVLTQFSNRTNWPMHNPVNYLCNYSSNIKIEPQVAQSRPGICILKTNDIKFNSDVIPALLNIIFSSGNCRMVTPEDADYKKVERLVKV